MKPKSKKRIKEEECKHEWESDYCDCPYCGSKHEFCLNCGELKDES